MPAKDLEILLPSLSAKTIQGEVVYNGPIEAPVKKGQRLAELVLQPEELPEVRLPLVAESDVPAGGFVVRVKTAAQVLIKQFLQGPEGAL